MYPIILFTVIIFLTYYLSFHLSSKFKKNRHPLPPSPFKLPFIGNLHQLGPLLHRSLQKLSAKHGPLMFLQLGRVPTFVVSSPEIAEQVLRTNDVALASRPALKAARFILYDCKDIGFSPYGKFWRQMRKICTVHLLSSRMIHHFKHVREEEVALMLERITRSSALNAEKPDAEVAVSMTDILHEYTTDLLCRTALGGLIKSDTKKKALIELVRTNAILFGGFYVEDFFPGLWWVDVILGSERRLKKHFRKVDALLQEIVEEHEQMIGSKGEEEVMVTTTNFVEVLLSLQGPPLKKEHIKAISWDIITAGSDTASTLLDWIMAELIKNPASMKKAQQELREKSHVTDGLLIEVKILNEMEYLKAVIKETLRLHLSVPLLVPRECIQECEIQGYVIPKQSRVIVNAWSIARDSQYWEAAEEFMPERWLGSIVDYKGQDFHYLPFGAGRRICLGMQFGLAVVEIALANLLYYFDWKLPNGMKGCDMDMSESSGLTSKRKQKLELIALRPQVY